MKNKPSSTSGVALVIVLGFLVIISALAVAFFSSITTELKGARTFASGVTTRQLADSAANIVMAQIRDATARENGCWASQPGMIRVYRDVSGANSTPSKNAEAFIKLYSSDQMTVDTPDLPAFVSNASGDYDPEFYEKPAFWTDLNAPVVVQDPLTGAQVPHFPVIDPRAMGVVQGFSFTTNKVHGAVAGGSDDDRLPMPVRWIYVLQDGTLTVPSQGATTVAQWPVTTDGKMPSKDNPIVGRIAFWTDDDSNKVNINTAGGFVNTPEQLPSAYKSDYSSYAGSYWDTPRFMTNFDYGVPNGEKEPNPGLPKDGQPSGGLALTQLLQGEFQRYPGHPATTSLGVIFGAYLTSEDLWRILPRISTANYSGVASSSATASTFVDKFSYGTDGGIKRVVVGAAAAGGGKDNQNLLPKTERLYASVDELLFASNRAGPLDPTSPSYQRMSNDQALGASGPSKLTPDRLDRLRFFLTASSRAPELNLFGRPRVTIWPVRSETNTETLKLSTSIAYPQWPDIASDGGTGLNPYDKVMLFCSTIGPVSAVATVKTSDQAPGTSTALLPYRYIFFRRNPYLSSDRGTANPAIVLDDIADVNLPRNKWLLETYLTKLTSQPVPGFGGNLKQKWDVSSKPNRDQLLVEIFDYCRCANLQDGTSLQFTPTTINNRYFAPRGLIAPTKVQFAEPVTTVGAPQQGRNGKTYSTGMGRFPCISEATLDFYYAGPTWFKDKDGKIKVEKATDAELAENSSLEGYPRFRQMRAFLILSTFNPMFGYAPMATPGKNEPRISFEVTGLEQLQYTYGPVTASLNFPDKDKVTGNNLSTTMYVPSGSAYTGRNMGGYEGFMHIFHPGPNPLTGDATPTKLLWKIRKDFTKSLPLALNGGPVPGNSGKGNDPIPDAQQEYYPFQTSLQPYTAALGRPDTSVTDEVGTLLPTKYDAQTLQRFAFIGNSTPIVVKVWYDTYTPATRPAKLAAVDYTPVQTVNLTFPSSPKDKPFQIPRGDEEMGTPDPPYNKASNPEGRANFDVKTNQKLGNWYWTSAGSFCPSLLWSGTPPTLSGVTWRDEWYKVTAPPNTTPLDGLNSPLEASWSLASRILWACKNSDNPDGVRATGGSIQPYNWYPERWRNIVQPGDVVKSLVFCDTPQTSGGGSTSSGDMRLAVMMDQNGEMKKHPDYDVSGNMHACGLRTGSGSVYFPNETFYGSMADLGSGKYLSQSGAPANLPVSGPSNSKGATGGVRSVIRGDASQPGDFDQGIGIFADGPYANKEDEGNVVFAWWDEINRVYHYPIPYFTDTWSYEKPGNTFTSPLRQLPSPVMFGSLPTRAASMQGWTTLCFCPYPAGDAHPGNVEPKDHLLLDLFNMPIVEPYPISEPFSTAGKINLNYRIAPFDYITRTTALRAALAPIRVTGVDTSDYARYKTGDPNNKDSDQHNGRLTTNYRKIVDCNSLDPNAASNTLKAFEDYFDQGKNDPSKGMFKSASQICEMPLYPLGEPNITAFWNRCTLTGDNVREKPYADLYPRITTKSNTFTVHFRVQTLRQVPRNAVGNASAYAIWEEGKDSILGEYRGSTTIERYIDPGDTRFSKWIGGQPNLDYINPDETAYDKSKDPAVPTAPSNPTRSLELVYRFRTVMNKKFAP